MTIENIRKTLDEVEKMSQRLRQILDEMPGKGSAWGIRREIDFAKDAIDAAGVRLAKYLAAKESTALRDRKREEIAQ